MKPKICVEASWFVVHLDDQPYVLGKTEAGIGPAVREALQLCLARVDRMKDAEIDYSDIPPLDKSFLKKATTTWPP